MASKCSLLVWLSLVVACGGVERYPLRAPVANDTDLRPVHVACEARPTPKDPKHVACAPEPYVSPLVWDAADNSVFRPLSRALAVDPPGEAVNVNALDEVPDSAWFENRLGAGKLTRQAMLRGACTQGQLLDPATAAPASFVIDQGKPNGWSPGFRIRVNGTQKYMLKADAKEQPERPSAASVIGAAIYNAVGFNTSCEQIIYVAPNVFVLTPGLTVTDNSGIPRPFDAEALGRVLAQAPKRGALVRLQASAWLPGYLLGPFRYEGTRSDDPNDIVPHEDRRDLRGARLVAAWIDHFDAREQNTMDAWLAVNAKVNDSSPGFVRHYYLDTSDALGSEWEWDGVSRRLGHSYLLDYGDIATDFVTFGAKTQPWDHAARTPGMEVFGYFSARDFDPEGWKNEYPNPAFSRATERDNAWMARILARFTPEDVRALATLGQFSKPEHAAFLGDLLERRLVKILERYLLRLSALGEPRVEGDTLVLTDLARRRAVRPPSAFAYRARLDATGAAVTLRLEIGAEGRVAVRLSHRAFAPGVPEDDASRYVVVALANGASRYALRAHLYDLGVDGGFRLAGVERPEKTYDELAQRGAAW